MAVWFVTLLSIITAFLIAAAKIHEPKWLCPALVISAICFVPLFLLGVFLMQTVFRKELQEDQYYSEWLRKHEQVFKGFKPENLRADTGAGPTNLQPLETSMESERVKRYQAQKGLFLVHSWRPSLTRGQVADIVIWVHQHGEGPLTHSLIDRVEYELGPKFFNKPHVKRNCQEQFKLEVSAYGPMLCLASIYLKDGTSPILLDRYIDFDEPPAAPRRRVVSSHTR